MEFLTKHLLMPLDVLGFYDVGITGSRKILPNAIEWSIPIKMVCFRSGGVCRKMGAPGKRFEGGVEGEREPRMSELGPSLDQV